MPGRSSLRLLIAALSLLILATTACTPSNPIRGSSSPSSAQSQAQRLADGGNYAAAAAAFQSAAAEARGKRRAQLLLKAARYYTKANDIGAAENAFRQVKRPRRGDLATTYRIVDGELAIARGLPDAALVALGTPPSSRSPASLKARYHLVRARAFGRLRQPVNAADARIRVAEWETNSREQADNQSQLLYLLPDLTAVERDNLVRLGHRHAQGWLALSDTLRRAGPNSAARERAFNDWRYIYPNHPAAKQSAMAQSAVSPAFSASGSTSIGVLLPAGGPYVNAAATIRQGIMAALYSLPASQRPAIRFYDTMSSPRILDTFQTAVNDGARLVIGPLTKEKVGALSQGGFLSTPVVALNRVPNGISPPSGFYQFSLSPEDEARQVAERAGRDGFRSAAVLWPVGTWGQRYADAFREAWELSGGFVTSMTEYDSKAHHFSGPIRQMLSGTPDFVYLVGKPLKSRQLRTQIQFYGSATMPVFLTSRAVDNPRARSENLDLNGAIAPAMPWTLDGFSETNLQPVRDGAARAKKSYGRFFAMGYDALNLAMNLKSLSSGYSTLDGATGKLSLSADGLVRREPTWITFVNGNPTPLASGYFLDR